MLEDLIIFAAVFLASFVQSTLGFGFALVSVPILLLFLPVHQAISITFVIGSLINFFVYKQNKEFIDFAKIKYLLFFAVIGTIFAGIFLRSVESAVIETSVYILILLVTLYMLSKPMIKLKKQKTSQVSSGLLAGTINTLAAVSGPIIVLYLQSLGMKKREFLSSISIILIALNIFSLIALFKLEGTNALIEPWKLIVMAAFVPMTVYIGGSISKKINEKVFSKIVLVGIVAITISRLAETLV